MKKYIKTSRKEKKGINVIWYERRKMIKKDEKKEKRKEPPKRRMSDLIGYGAIFRPFPRNEFDSHTQVSLFKRNQLKDVSKEWRKQERKK